MKTLYYKFRLVFLIFLGLFFYIIYQSKIISVVNNYNFSNESVAAYNFTFGNIIFAPISLYLAFITIVILLWVIKMLKSRSFDMPDKTLAFKHMGLFVALLIASAVVMQCHTTVYTDGTIRTYNFIDKFSSEYSVQDYKKVVFSGESKSSISPKRPYRTYFQFSFTFFLEDGKHLEFYSEDFRDGNTIKNLGDTLGDKFSVVPESGLGINEITNMSEYERQLYYLMYCKKSNYDFNEDEDFTEQEYYAFDGNEDFKEDYDDEEYTIFPEEFSLSIY